MRLLLALVLLLPQSGTPDPPTVPLAAQLQILRLQRDINAIQADILYMETQRQKMTEQLQQTLKQFDKEGFELNPQTLTYTAKPGVEK